MAVLYLKVRFQGFVNSLRWDETSSKNVSVNT